MFHLFWTYVAANALCCKCSMSKDGKGGGSPLRRSGPRVRVGSEAGATVPMYMHTATTGACVGILVLGLVVRSIKCASAWDHARTGTGTIMLNVLFRSFLDHDKTVGVFFS
jgi:hypothetical protein